MTKKRAIIAGVGPGNGMALARRFAAGGYDLVLLARSADKLQTYAADAGLAGVAVNVISADFSSLQDTQTKINEAVACLGGVDVLVFNASVYVEKSWRDLSAEDLMEEVTIGAGAAYAAMRAVGQYMVQHDGGVIIATGGGSALDPVIVTDAPGLAVTKGAMRNLVLAMAPQFAKDNIYLATVTIMGSVQPGGFYDPAAIAERIYDTAHLPEDERVSEILFQEKSVC